MMITLLAWFFLKHFICDFPLQAHPWMYRNKGTYGHPGGLVHAGIHALGSIVVLWSYVTLPYLYLLVMFDFIAHYHIDYGKVKIGAIFNLKPDNSEWFWILLGFDQLLHYFTYYLIVVYASW